MGMRKLDWLLEKLYIIGRAHIFNPLWLPREQRRQRRADAMSVSIPWYFRRNCMKCLNGLDPGQVVKDDAGERIWSIWFQGESEAPAIVKACFASMRRHCANELVVLDEAGLRSMTCIPEEIWRKYEQGLIPRANFSDICRLDLLYRYGGYWLDSTCFVTSPVPSHIVGSDFFLYMMGTLYGSPYSYVQNCFIRARKGDYLLAAWREMTIDYWLKHNHRMDYFMHQLMFKTLVLNDPRAISEFAEMPKEDMDATHVLQCGRGMSAPYIPEQFAEDISGAFFQKMTYRGADDAPDGSIADYIKKTVSGN